MKKDMHVAFNFGSIVQVSVEIYDGLSIDECVALYSEDVKQYLLPGDDAWRTVSSSYADAKRHLQAIEQEQEIEAERDEDGNLPLTADTRQRYTVTVYVWTGSEWQETGFYWPDLPRSDLETVRDWGWDLIREWARETYGFDYDVECPYLDKDRWLMRVKDPNGLEEAWDFYD